MMLAKGISQDHIDMMKYCGIDFHSWLSGFESPEKAVRSSVELVRHHPLMPDYIKVRGFIINSQTGELVEVQV